MIRRSVVRRGVALVTVLALLGACGSDDPRLERADDATTTTTAPTAPTTGPPPTATTVPAIEWTPCGAVECASVAVPVDHDDAGGSTIELFVTRLPATGDRIGPLFVNFGGPGAGAADVIERFGFPPAVRARFDIVAIDPRGVGRSAPLGCGLDPVELYTVDPTVEDAADAAALVDTSRRYADDCAARAGELLAHVGTRDVARDLDLVRAAMGDEQLSYVGYSYGTSIGQIYAELFPDRVRAMVLDGIVDPAPAGVEVAVQQAQGFEDALGSWAAGCTGRRSCPFGDDALAAVDQVLDRSEDVIPSSNGRQLGPGEAVIGMAYPLYDASLWDELDRAVARAVDGDGEALVDLADAYLGIVDFAPYFAVSCLDSSWPRTPEEHLRAAASAASAAPRFGEAIVNDYLRCAVWPEPAEPLGAVDAGGAPPILVVSTTGDPATPHDNGVRVADRLDSGVLLEHEGEGHTIVFQGSSCVDGLAIPYLVDLAVPAAGSRC